jgi:hypothetical protein
MWGSDQRTCTRCIAPTVQTDGHLVHRLTACAFGRASLAARAARSAVSNGQCGTSSCSCSCSNSCSTGVPTRLLAGIEHDDDCEHEHQNCYWTPLFGGRGSGGRCARGGARAPLTAPPRVLRGLRRHRGANQLLDLFRRLSFTEPSEAQRRARQRVAPLDRDVHAHFLSHEQVTCRFGRFPMFRALFAGGRGAAQASRPACSRSDRLGSSGVPEQASMPISRYRVAVTLLASSRVADRPVDAVNDDIAVHFLDQFVNTARMHDGSSELERSSSLLICSRLPVATGPPVAGSADTGGEGTARTWHASARAINARTGDLLSVPAGAWHSVRAEERALALN